MHGWYERDDALPDAAGLVGAQGRVALPQAIGRVPDDRLGRDRVRSSAAEQVRRRRPWIVTRLAIFA
jgi:hypothetical protein